MCMNGKTGFIVGVFCSICPSLLARENNLESEIKLLQEWADLLLTHSEVALGPRKS